MSAEAVRRLHRPVDIEPSDTICGECSYQLPNGRYFGKVVEFPCPTLDALAEQGEPEWEYEVSYSSGSAPSIDGYRLRRGMKFESVEKAREFAALVERPVIRKRKKAVAAGEWLPVPDTTNQESEGKP